MSQARFSVQTAVAEGFGFWRANVLKAIGPLLIAAMAGVGATLVDRKFALAALATNFLALVMAQGALYRISLGGPDSEVTGRRGPLGFQWGWLESRLALVIVLLFLVPAFAAIVMVFLLVVALLGVAGGDAALSATSPEDLMAGLSPAAGMAFNVGVFLAFAALLALIMRLAMVVPSTVARGRVQFLSTLGLTRGSVLRLALATLLANLPIFALQGMALAYIQLTDSPGLVPWVDGAATALTPILFIPVSVGMMSHIYQRLREGADQ